MDNYELEQPPFYSKGSVSLFKGVSLLRNNRPVVVKQHQFDRRASGVAKDISKVLNAALAQAKVQHEHSCDILDLQFTCDEKSFKVMHILEAMDCDVGEDILQRRDSKQQYSEKELWTFLKQTSSALAYVHSKKVAHRDIKPKNIFRSNDSYKVGDFGSFFVKTVSSFTATIEGTLLYMSPQQRRNFSNFTPYDAFKADVFALGATLLEMASLSPPDILSETQNLDEVVGREVTTLPYSEKLQRVLVYTLAFKEEDRPTMQQLLDYVTEFLTSRIEPATEKFVEPGTLMHVGRTYIRSFSFATLTWSQSSLASPVEVDAKSRYLWTEAGLFCCGSKAQIDSAYSKKAYLLQAGQEWAVTALPNMFNGRAGAGLWYLSAQSSVHVFGGKYYSGQSNAYLRKSS